MQLRVSLSFARLPDTDLASLGQTVVNQITGNAAFPTPPVTLLALQAAVDDFSEKIAAAYVGGPVATAAKNNARDVLLGMLRKVAAYVQINCNDDMEILLSSGFTAMSTNRASLPLPQPDGLTVRNGNTGELIVSVTPLPNSSMYEAHAKPEGGDWLPSTFSGNSRRITVSGLTPGTMYTVEVRGLGGQTGQSPWSAPTMQRSL